MTDAQFWILLPVLTFLGIFAAIYTPHNYEDYDDDEH
tara:strand:- start:211 stop:321 length:111 start_codon:yes stop_codon:yes gene_type:complete